MTESAFCGPISGLKEGCEVWATYASLGAAVAFRVDPNVLGNDDSPLVELCVLVDLYVVARQSCVPAISYARGSVGL